MIFNFDHKKSWNAANSLNPSSLHVSMKPSRCHCAVDTAAPSKALRDEHFQDSEIPLAILPVRNMGRRCRLNQIGTLFCNHQFGWTLYDDFNAAHVVTYHLNYHKIGMEGIGGFEFSSMMFFSIPASGVQQKVGFLWMRKTGLSAPFWAFPKTCGATMFHTSIVHI